MVKYMNYGEKLKELREYNNINRRVSQKEVAEAIGIKRSSYNQFEQQYDIIPIKRLNQIANFFNVSIDYIFDLTKELNYSKVNYNIDLEKSSKRLKEFRKNNKLTQIELAKILKVSPSVIIHHETKRNPLGTPFLYELCFKYNISADYLLGRIDYPKNFK